MCLTCNATRGCTSLVSMATDYFLRPVSSVTLAGGRREAVPGRRGTDVVLSGTHYVATSYVVLRLYALPVLRFLCCWPARVHGVGCLQSSALRQFFSEVRRNGCDGASREESLADLALNTFSSARSQASAGNLLSFFFDRFPKSNRARPLLPRSHHWVPEVTPSR